MRANVKDGLLTELLGEFESRSEPRTWLLYPGCAITSLAKDEELFAPPRGLLCVTQVKGCAGFASLPSHWISGSSATGCRPLSSIVCMNILVTQPNNDWRPPHLTNGLADATVNAKTVSWAVLCLRSFMPVVKWGWKEQDSRPVLFAAYAKLIVRLRSGHASPRCNVIAAQPLCGRDSDALGIGAGLAHEGFGINITGA